ncbi:hypothetical protein M427DRAFT_365712 [Gonapodya prolifera JEL478]|uniref:Uncharacterized protein n=1 Tax=Gonapodya prolifera (strain JEL478) TaxID=1344416 RepID=A0A139A9W6_GONPJ|nr:hypothetical protein M427DRAFT_365712 [Gonapodya prolifera JEL478]|eukprot:KXS13642.1 hypothetical protein M427DRAFT_365712 [Gonapodya prolifera JEL478]
MQQHRGHWGNGSAQGTQGQATPLTPAQLPQPVNPHQQIELGQQQMWHQQLVNQQTSTLVLPPQQVHHMAAMPFSVLQQQQFPQHQYPVQSQYIQQVPLSAPFGSNHLLQQHQLMPNRLHIQQNMGLVSAPPTTQRHATANGATAGVIAGSDGQHHPRPIAPASAPSKRSSTKNKPPTPTLPSSTSSGIKNPTQHPDAPPPSNSAQPILKPPKVSPNPGTGRATAGPAPAISGSTDANTTFTSTGTTAPATIRAAVQSSPFVAGTRAVHPLLPPLQSLLPPVDLPFRFASSDQIRLREAERYLAAYSAPEDGRARAVKDAVAIVDGTWM